jgi:hypothetical protein
VTYLLSPTHPQGASKAKFFKLMGYDMTKADELGEIFLRALPYAPAKKSRFNPEAGMERWEAVIEIPREGGGTANVQTIWEVHLHRKETRFLTAYPYRKRRKDE